MKKLSTLACTAVLAAGAAGTASAADSVFVGHLADYTGATAFVGKFYGAGVRDALSYINKHGGLSGTKLEFETVDYSYQVPRAISQYKKWLSDNSMTAMQGWGTGDTEALIDFVAKDQVPVWSASYSGHLTDPTGKNAKTKKPAPYNFFYGPSYSDACRALVRWAADDWKAKGKTGAPKFIHMGDNHPYPNAPKEACGEYAQELGFVVLPPVVVSLKPGDFKAQCLTVKEAAADYAYMANLGGSVVSLLKSCDTVGLGAQFMTNIWGADRFTIEAAGDSAKNIIFPAATAFWTDDAPGLALVREVSKESDPDAKEYRTHHYIRGICSAFYMKEAMEWAKVNGGITGPNVKKGMYAKKDWVPKGLDGVCLPSTWTETDHRGNLTVNIYKGSFNAGAAKIEKVTSVSLPRRDDWLGY
ncbi:MAG: ABC transporter substrate-binding protein [Alphaproteobacteria bacterium]|nr:ABC transporter substrate-binding protein [Alphaproteobacteria bacterium]